MKTPHPPPPAATEPQSETPTPMTDEVVREVISRLEVPRPDDDQPLTRRTLQELFGPALTSLVAHTKTLERELSQSRAALAEAYERAAQICDKASFALPTRGKFSEWNTAKKTTAQNCAATIRALRGADSGEGGEKL